MKSTTRRLLTGVVAVTALAVLTAPAHAIHLFPLTPVFDPFGHDCAKGLEAAPAEAASEVAVVGFSFVDTGSQSSTSSIQVGESVTWSWLADHCHSVTFTSEGSPDGTLGGPNSVNQPELVRIADDGGASFTATFVEPGTYSYICVHHVGMGMTGTVVVSAA